MILLQLVEPEGCALEKGAAMVSVIQLRFQETALEEIFAVIIFGYLEHGSNDFLILLYSG